MAYCVIKIAQFVKQDTPGPSIENQVMEDKNQPVFFFSQFDEGETQQGAAGQFECLVRLHGCQP